MSPYTAACGRKLSRGAAARCRPPWSRVLHRSRTFVRLAVAIGIAAAASAPASLAAQELAQLEEIAIRSAVERIAPSVVRIETVGGLEQVNEVLQGDGPTTGLIVSSDGFILSSTFNFLRQPSSILVTLPGGGRAPARIVARDLSRKLVLLRVQSAEPLSVPAAVPTAEVAVGQTAIAVGRTFSAEKPNVSVGIISATRRIWGKALQTDAKISPSNYGGPLVDLQGRVFGILVPMSPDSENETAGAEWYDGGIGFAVPLAELNPRLEQLKKGDDLHPGLLGITLRSGDIYSMPAELAACHPKSPAYRAGLRAGDTLVAVNGRRIERQVQLRHALGPLYAGDQVELEVLRGGERRRVTIELAQRIDPYERPFLGILPVRGAAGDQAGVAIRHVYPDSAAASALRVGDRVRSLMGKEVADAAALRDGLAAFEPQQEVQLAVLREGNELAVSVKLGALPAAFPAAEAVTVPAAGPEQPAGLTVVKIPEEPNECAAYVPASYRPESPAGLLIVLPTPGAFQADEFSKQWFAVAERYGVIVVAAQASMPTMWLPTETAFIRKVVDHFTTNYAIDRTRMVVYGAQASGAMAYLAAFRLRDLVRGIVAVDAAIPLLVARPPDNDPIERLGIVAIMTRASANAKTRIERSLELLRALKYPVIGKELAGEQTGLDEATQEEIFRWIDTLDGI